MARRPISIRRSLLGNLVTVLLLLSIAILTTTTITVRRTIRGLSARAIEEALTRVENALGDYFSQVDAIRDETAAWVENGVIAVDAPDGPERILSPLLRRRPQVSAVHLVTTSGASMTLERTADGWIQRCTAGGDDGDRVRTWTSGAPPGPFTIASPDRAALPSSLVPPAGAPAVWSDPAQSVDRDTPEMRTAVTRVDPAGRPVTVVLDVGLDAVSSFLTDLNVSPRGSAFVLTEDGRLLGLPARFLPRTEVPTGENGRRRLRHPADLGITVLHDASIAFHDLPPDDRMARPYRFDADGQAWWAELRFFELGPERRIVAAALVPETDVLPDLDDTRLALVLIILVVLSGALARALVLARRYSVPIEQLVAESVRMSRGDLERRPPVVSNVLEVRRLARAIERMRTGLRSLIKLEDDLRIARTIQQSTFPDDFPPVRGFDIAGWSDPAEETGGDTYDVIPLDEDERGEPTGAALLLADATGHGIGPALSVTQVRAMLRMATRVAPDLIVIIDHLNAQLERDLPPGHFVTAWIALLDFNDGRLRWFSAGQAPMLHYRAGDGRVETRYADTFPLGIATTLDLAEPSEAVLEAGDVFVVLSDGFYETTDPEGEEFGIERIADLVRDEAKRGVDASTLLDTMRDHVTAHGKGKAPADDRTAIVVRRKA